jgi:hypothetical protein
MPRLDIITTSGVTRAVEAQVCVRGLFIHADINTPNTRVISHSSGTAVITGIPAGAQGDQLLRNVLLPRLLHLNWTLSSTTIYDSDAHVRAIEEANADVLSYYERARIKEARLAKKIDGTAQPGSGARPHKKRDVANAIALVDHKFTDQEQFTVDLRDLEFIRVQALRTGKIPALLIEFTAPNATSVGLFCEDNVEFNEEEVTQTLSVVDQKSYSLPKSLAVRLRASTCVRIDYGERRWLLVTNRRFLEIVHGA